MTYSPRGFIALTSAIVISSVLLLLITAGSLSGFIARINALQHELKEQSRASALACIDHALLSHAYDPEYNGDESVIITNSPSVRCSISLFSYSGQNSTTVTFQVSAVAEEAKTVIEVAARKNDHVVTAFKEIPQ